MITSIVFTAYTIALAYFKEKNMTTAVKIISESVFPNIVLSVTVDVIFLLVAVGLG